jgi:hypothetical protein
MQKKTHTQIDNNIKFPMQKNPQIDNNIKFQMQKTHTNR